MPLTFSTHPQERNFEQQADLLSERLKPMYVTQLATLMHNTFIYEAFFGR